MRVVLMNVVQVVVVNVNVVEFGRSIDAVAGWLGHVKVGRAVMVIERVTWIVGCMNSGSVGVMTMHWMGYTNNGTTNDLSMRILKIETRGIAIQVIEIRV